MVQPAAGYRPADPWSEPGLDDAPQAPPTAFSRTTRSPPGAEEVTAIASRSGRTATEPILTERVRMPRREAAEVAIQRGLDAFRGAMTPTYHTPDGDVRVSAAFLMSHPLGHGANAAGASPATNRVQSDLQAAAHRAHLEPALGQIRSGRGTPDQIRSLTQALIDEGHLPPSATGTLQQRVRTMMARYGIGIDCAGDTQQAYLSATGMDRRGARFGCVANEDLSHLDRRGYRRIDDLADACPGDIVVLGVPAATSEDPHPVGHCAIIYDQRIATAADMRLLLDIPGAPSFAVGGPIRVFEVDSSWGCNGVAEVGGVARENWWYNESTREWAWQGQGDGHSARPFGVSPMPYGHPFDSPGSGIFRDPRRTP